MDNLKAVFFDIDNTLYDSTLQVEMVRRSAIRAMIEAGLDISEEQGLSALNGIVGRFGSNYERQFDDLLKGFGYPPSPRIVAAGIVAYHTTKIAYLVPYPDTIPTLLSLRDRRYKLGVITEGRSVKQWEKLIRLGLQHFFHAVVISEEANVQKPDAGLFAAAAEKVGCSPNEAVMVGDRLDKDIRGAKKAGMSAIQVMRGKYSGQKPASKEEEPDCVVPNLREILSLLK